MKTLATVGLAAISAGCLYTEPLVPGVAESVDGRLLGAWRCVAPESSNPAILTVAQAPSRGYRAEFVDGDDKSVFSVYEVKFENTLLINVQEVVDGEPRKWTFGRYTLYRPTLLHIEFARDEPFRDASTSADRAAVLKRELRGARLFEDYCTCIRIEAP